MKKRCKECEITKKTNANLRECYWWELWCRAKVAKAKRKAKKEEM